MTYLVRHTVRVWLSVDAASLVRFLGALLENHLLEVVVGGLVELQEVLRFANVAFHAFKVLRELRQPLGVAQLIIHQLLFFDVQPHKRFAVDSLSLR